ncbi:MAG: hypothetical protein K2P92_04085 [Bdellovibrionaceae bacterium]|nr:hypothetical protein [Pseudobdellovibrionaceae bacterium]
MKKLMLAGLSLIAVVSTSLVFAKEAKKNSEPVPAPLSREVITKEMQKQTELTRASKTTQFQVSSVEKDDYKNTVIKSIVKLENGETCSVQGKESLTPPVPGEKNQKSTLQIVNVKTECTATQKK